MIRSEHLAYFKALLEGRAELSWRAWFKRNEAQLSQDLPRAAFLRLKFQMLDEAEKLLRESGIEFTVSPLARRERYYANLHESVLDENGRPLESFRREAFDGAIGHFFDGRPEQGKENLAKYLRKLQRRPEIQRAEDLGDFCFDGEIELEYGNREIGRSILELVAAMKIGDDLVDPVIFRARELLDQRPS
jgi:hypothetical protein